MLPPSSSSCSKSTRCKSVPLVNITTGSFGSLFGALLVISFCDFNFIMKHFKFLKTVTGKGVFNLFLASMFLVGNSSSVWGYVMTGSFAFFGLFFVLVGCACIEGYDDSDIKKDEVKAQAKNKLGSSTKGSDRHDSQSLLDDA